jgi:hypothetical protein
VLEVGNFFSMRMSNTPFYFLDEAFGKGRASSRYRSTAIEDCAKRLVFTVGYNNKL